MHAVADASATRVASETFDLGNDEKVTIETLAEWVIDVVGAESEITYQPLPEDDPHVRRPDLSEVTSAVDWSPMVSLDDGLQWTVAAFDGSAD